MLEVKDQFEKLESCENMDSSYTILYTLLNHSISFFTSKQESRNIHKASVRSKHLLEGSKSKRKGTISKDRESVGPKEIIRNMHKHSIIPSEQTKMYRNQNSGLQSELYFAEGKQSTVKNCKTINKKNELRDSSFKTSERLKQFKLTEKRINPKLSQENCETDDKQNKTEGPQTSYISKEVDKSITLKQMPSLNIKKMANVNSCQQNLFKYIKCEDDSSVFDSIRKYESEHEQQLDVKPERISFGPKFSDTDSESGGLRLTLKQ